MTEHPPAAAWSRSPGGTCVISLVLFLALWSLASWTYGPSCADRPRRDDLWYMAERAGFRCPWEWWRHTLSFTRTRKLAPGDYFLCRPAHYAVLTAVDVFFRGRPSLSAKSSILWIAIAATSLCLATRPLLGWIPAALLAANFVVQYPGQEIVCWRHISPYLLSVSCLGFGAAIARKPGSWHFATPFWILGTLFHECIAMTLAVTAAAVFLMSRLPRRNAASPDAAETGFRSQAVLLLALSVPVATYAAWNAADFVIHRPPELLGSSPSPAPRTFEAAVTSVTSVFNASATAYLTPWKVQLAPHESGVLAWFFDPNSRSFQRAGAVLLTVVLWLVHRHVRIQHSSALIALLGIGLLLSITVALGLGRGFLRGPGYLYQATYYYSLTAYAISLILAAGLSLMNDLTPDAISRWARGGVLVWLAASTLTGAVRIHQTLLPRQEALARWSADHERIFQEVRSRGARLAGIVPGHESAVASRISMLILQDVRWPDPAKPDLYLSLSPDGCLSLQPLRHPTPDTQREATSE